MVTRREGYQRSAGKESLALEVVAIFFARVLNIHLDGIADEAENYALGDFRTASGATVECKGQPIDPDRYRQNFVELFEVTKSERHRGGLAVLAGLLNMSVERLASVPVWMARPKRSAPLGQPACISVSIRSIAGSAATVYVNYQMGGRHIYVYERDELMDHIKAAVPQGLLRGAGQSNDDTFAVKIPVAARRWSRSADNAWAWRGIGSERDAVAYLRDLL